MGGGGLPRGVNDRKADKDEEEQEDPDEEDVMAGAGPPPPQPGELSDEETEVLREEEELEREL